MFSCNFPVVTVTHAESESMPSRRRVAARGMASCVARSPTTIREVRPRRTPKRPRRWLQRKFCRIEAAIAALRDDDGQAGASHDSPRAQTCTFQGPGPSNTTKIQREDTQRDTERVKRWRERDRKARNVGTPPFGAPPTLLGPTFSGAHPPGPTLGGPTFAYAGNGQKVVWAKSGICRGAPL